ncbi:DUF4838 domain-containing protein [Flavihumibacter sp. UBA7668]|uniref:DUF4838 domain-containing protein n=1 Tax=Flavihumibacter sp. UBA7668 TaxID=1946542 RepID=UPI0025C00675|nr:DUF4838 domain-containing protein [Flavihumibacter sp. UBA7668]
MGQNSTRKITRQGFLKEAGLLTGGFFLFPMPAMLNKNQPDLLTYQLIIPDAATKMEKEAAVLLRKHLLEVAAFELPIIKESEYSTDPAIFIGNTSYGNTEIDGRQLEQDGIIIKPVGNRLVLTGGSEQGILYAVYHYLELIGFRQFTSTVTYIPKAASISFPEKEIMHVPYMKYRTTNYKDTRETGYSNWHKLSSTAQWGLFVHTFNELVPPEEFGTSNPDFFSLINGNRLPGTQLCLSNEQMLQVVIQKLEKKIREKPAATYWSVSQNDNDQHCQCEYCTRLNKQYGGVPSGSIIYFVNQVARKFPDKIISTLAYWYSRKAPVGISIEPNVNIMLCNIESRRQLPVFKTDPAFSKDLTDWGKLTSNILIWDYNIQFTNLLSPFPNLHTIKPNIQFYKENHVNALFMQANAQAGGEMAALRAYLISKLMFDPELDDDAVINDFLHGYYGSAGNYIRQYIDRMWESLLKTGAQLNIFGGPNDAKDSWLSVEMMEEYKRIFDQAEAAVSTHSELLRRVKIARLPILYAEIQIGRNEIGTPRSMFERLTADKIRVKPAMKKMVKDFVQLCKEDGVSRLQERSTPPDDFLQSYNRIFHGMDEMEKVVSVGKKILPVNLPDKSHAAITALTDGVLGSYESWSNPDIHWVAYKGTHMDFVLDLGKRMTIHSVSMDFLNAQAQADWNLHVLPSFVSYAISEDGQNYSAPQKIVNPHNPNPFENRGIINIPFHTFRATFNRIKARYIRVHAESMLQLPSWHIRKGQPAWMYTDEIIVK